MTKSEYAKKYHRENKDKINARKRQQYKDNPEGKKQYYSENKEKLKLNRLKKVI